MVMGWAEVNGDIEIEIGTAEEPGAFKVQVLHSVGGGMPRGRLVLDVDGVLGQRDDLERTVLASAVLRRGVASAAERPVREVGRQLFEALFTGPVYGTYRASLGAAQQRGKRLRVVLRLTVPQLAALPWEAMFDPETGAYLCRTEPLVRRVDAPYTSDPLEVDPPLRILGLVAAPRGLPALDVEAEQQHLEQALAKPLADGLVELTWAPDCSWEAIHDLMLDGAWHILHFVGHGDYDAGNDEGVLALVGPGGRADLVEASRLTDLLSEANPTPPLVVLNSCSSAELGARDLFSGTAATLVHRGISAVAAMQFAISDVAAIRFARGFYAAIARGRGIDEALRSGRIEILGTARTLEWITPVLYIRGGATQLFNLTSSTGPTSSPPSQKSSRARPVSSSAALRTMYIQARAEMRVQHYDAAIDVLGELLALNPGYPEAAELLERARHGKQLADAYVRARAAEDAGDWGAAISGYDSILQADQSYQDARSHREDCLKQQQIADRQVELRHHYSAGSWQAVLAVDAELAGLDPAAADPGGLATKARAELGRADPGSSQKHTSDSVAPPNVPRVAAISPILLDKLPTERDLVVIANTAYALRTPRPEAVELVRLDLPSGMVTEKISFPEACLIGASSGGVVVSDGQAVTTYDPQLRATGQWNADKGWAVLAVVATNRCGWVLAASPETTVSRMMSTGKQFIACLVRINLTTGTVQTCPLGTDTYWTSPAAFRGAQLMSTGAQDDDAEVVALQCEWTASGMAVTKRKIATFASEDLNDLRSYTVGTTTWLAPGPDPRQILRWNDLTLFGFWSVVGAKSRVALSSTEGQIESPALLREFDGLCPTWIPAPPGPVVLAPTADRPPKTEVWRLIQNGNELRHCSTMPGSFWVRQWELFGSLREQQVGAAVESDRLWWGVSEPGGLACLDADNTVTRIDHPGNPFVFAAGEGCIHVTVNSEAGGLELRTIQIR
jgi:tetratricopeptide (TPR) repeat protein